MKLPENFSEEDISDIKQAVLNAELDTSGEIRVHIENECHRNNAIERAMELFKKLKVYKTSNHNGVLFYVAVKSKQFAIIGDTAINNVIDANFWDFLRDTAIGYFTDGNYTDGLIDIIQRTGLELKKHFPHTKNDINELPDDISIG